MKLSVLPESVFLSSLMKVVYFSPRKKNPSNRYTYIFNIMIEERLGPSQSLFMKLKFTSCDSVTFQTE